MTYLCEEIEGEVGVISRVLPLDITYLCEEIEEGEVGSDPKSEKEVKYRWFDTEMTMTKIHQNTAFNIIKTKK